MHIVLIVYYSAAIIAASVVGGLLPDWVRLSHRRTELAVSFVAGAMLGVALLHMLPHALAGAGEVGTDPTQWILGTLRWVIVGFLAMFFIERFFCFHHHDVPEEAGDLSGEDGGDTTAAADTALHVCSEHDHPHTDHSPGLTWSGAAMGLTLHSILAGVALGASVRHAPPDATAAGFGAFIAILLHKPLDAMTIAMLMARGGWSPFARCVVNALFALAVPAGVAIFYAGMAPLEEAGAASPVALGLALSAGVFLCVAMSDLLPELHFHHHDRLKLSAALLLGLGAAEVACRLETHSHPPVGEVQIESPVGVELLEN